MKRTLWTIAAAGCLAAFGCNTDSSMHGGAGGAAPSISVSAANNDVVVGDTTTLTVNSRNTVGRDAHVEWMSTGGRVMPEENGRIARMSFDAPGTYTVTARLFFGDQEVARDAVNLNVKPLR
jgi:hypothetical protein